MMVYAVCNCSTERLVNGRTAATSLSVSEGYCLLWKAVLVLAFVVVFCHGVVVRIGHVDALDAIILFRRSALLAWREVVAVCLVSLIHGVSTGDGTSLQS
ncbi:hypothetical protein C8T65DRAFT_660695 [Cerioporus squamosus]|nr:hypothetical protein C8T65DRAFT_660695 [Cerioporus squamosus]